MHQKEGIRQVITIRDHRRQVKCTRLTKRLTIKDLPRNGQLLKLINKEKDPQISVHGLQGAFRGLGSVPEGVKCIVKGESQEVGDKETARIRREVVGECE